MLTKNGTIVSMKMSLSIYTIDFDLWDLLKLHENEKLEKEDKYLTSLFRNVIERVLLS